ncbi:MAG: hypothetical protein ACPG57_02890, partial [Porticoccaceae bacterium]
MHIQKPLPILVVILTVSLNSLAFSDQISLKNGDTLQGTLISQTDTYVLWQSDNFGELQIATDQIALISPTPGTNRAISTASENDNFKG